ncbi:hypothetical protein [Actinosynnema sp. NPDC023587]|uniref:hypothetical protein n=1 Tax=Actinosynnema sp. NPDC023587 TaxID=3154695 RepID=UPI0033F98D1A
MARPSVKPGFYSLKRWRPVPCDRRAENLENFLGASRMTRARLEQEIHDAAGAECAAFVAGSITEGYSNAYSDLDVHVVRDAAATSLPLMVHVDSCRIDLAFHTRENTEKALRTAAKAPVAGAGELTRKMWEHKRKAVSAASRLTCSVPLYGQGTPWDVRLPAEVVRDGAADWWRAEARRRLVAARLLATRFPRVAARRFHEAHSAFLEVLATRCGEDYFGFKWLPEKLKRLGWTDDLAAFRDALRQSTKPVPDFDWFERRIEPLIARDQADEKYSAVFSLAPGVSLTRLAGQSLLSRWNMRAAGLSSALSGLVQEAVGREDGILHTHHDWRDRDVPDGVVELFSADFLWLGVGMREHRGR